MNRLDIKISYKNDDKRRIQQKCIRLLSSFEKMGSQPSKDVITISELQDISKEKTDAKEKIVRSLVGPFLAEINKDVRENYDSSWLRKSKRSITVRSNRTRELRAIGAPAAYMEHVNRILEEKNGAFRIRDLHIFWMMPGWHFSFDYVIEIIKPPAYDTAAVCAIEESCPAYDTAVCGIEESCPAYDTAIVRGIVE